MPGLGAAASISGAILQAESAREPAQTIIDIAATAEAFAVTALGQALDNAATGKLKLSKEQIQTLTAARAQERDHLDAWEKVGGKRLYKSFTIPPAVLTDYDTLFKALVAEEAAETAAHIANMTLFTEMKRPDLVKVSFQYADEEAQHRLLANYALGTRPANDQAFAPAMFATIGDFLSYWKKQGIIGGSGTKIDYPGPGKIDDTNVTQQVPAGVAASCAVSGAATPMAGETGTRSGTPEASPVASPQASPMP